MEGTGCTAASASPARASVVAGLDGQRRNSRACTRGARRPRAGSGVDRLDAAIANVTTRETGAPAVQRAGEVPVDWGPRGVRRRAHRADLRAREIGPGASSSRL